MFGMCRKGETEFASRRKTKYIPNCTMQWRHSCISVEMGADRLVLMTRLWMGNKGLAHTQHAKA